MSLGEVHRVAPPRHCDIHSHHTGWSQSSGPRKQTQLQECLLSCYCIWTFDTHSVTTLEVSETQNTPTDEHSTNLKASSFVTEWFKSHRMELGKPSGGEAQCSWFWANQATAGEDGDEESEGDRQQSPRYFLPHRLLVPVLVRNCQLSVLSSRVNRKYTCAEDVVVLIIHQSTS